jgi:hypothetical protein
VVKIELITACAITLCLVSEASARSARCVITSSGATYRGKCDFTPMPGNGGFSIAPIGQPAFFLGVAPISVAKTSKETAEVRGLTREGINSRWGEATRLAEDLACWVGADFKICVY